MPPDTPTTNPLMQAVGSLINTVVAAMTPSVKETKVQKMEEAIDFPPTHRTGGHSGPSNRIQQHERPAPRRESRREHYTRVASDTLQAINKGSYVYRSDLVLLQPQVKFSEEETLFFGKDSVMRGWKAKPNLDSQGKAEAILSILNISTLDAARMLSNSYRFTAAPGPALPKTGVLNFASATKPGGGFRSGAEAQEESIARVSTLYPSLNSREGRKFYAVHSAMTEREHYYTPSVIFSPGVMVFRNDLGDAMDPYLIEVVSSAAVNAGKILEGKSAAQRAGPEVEIEAEMNERMGRILYLFEMQGIRNIVLGTFGTGVFKNRVEVVARLWARLLVGKNSRFQYSFDRVIFAITGDSTFVEFKGAFEAWVRQRDTPRAAPGRRRSEWQY